MTTVGIRDLLHHFSKHMKAVKAGKRLVIVDRNIPVADLIPHNKHVTQPGWRRKIKKIRVEGEPFSETVSKMRREDRF